MKIVVVGDIHVTADNFSKSAQGIKVNDKTIVPVEWRVKDKEEFQKKALNIEKNGPEAEPTASGLLEEIEDAELLLVHFAPVPRAVIEKAKRLKLIGTCRGGLEHIDVEAATDKNIPVMHIIRNAEPVADFTIGLMIAETRNIARSHHAIMQGKWEKEFPNSGITTTFKELKVGLVGLGHIGCLVARKLCALGVEVLGYDPFVTPDSLLKKGINIKMTTIEDLFKESDIISLHLRLTDDTQNIIDKKLISLMKPTAYLVNTSRAGVLEEEAIVEALEKKKIAGAALDVFWEEPIPAGHPLLKLDNVTLTAHLAGDTVDAIPRSPKLLVEEINKYLEKGFSELIVNQNGIK
ncbi:2-hydroxyacid dehydrogenase [Thermoanaerobacterium sp. DL9XJH110]|uniref:2-hydroxyacid dehydrogenase n=1 Tax=Thermoanaerobacterium sp. DL9XJH110 TaxID=3386643 RepID=UPI003BB565CB